MSVLIKGMKMPKDCPMCPCAHWNKLDILTGCELVWRYVPDSETAYWQSDKRPDWCPLVDVPTPHGPLIDVRALYERTAEWEAQALARVEKLDPRVENQRVGWVHWSVVLEERSAFKHDLMDAPTIIEAEEDSHE